MRTRCSACLRSCGTFGRRRVVDGVIDVNHSARVGPRSLRPRMDHRCWASSCYRADGGILKVWIRSGERQVVSLLSGRRGAKADIAEGIARFYGYDNIPGAAVRGQRGLLYRRKSWRTARRCLSGQGLNEVVTYTFGSQMLCKINLPADSRFADRWS
jgi:hypothetical protein